ncbi:TPA: terminase small subunit [Escherichia coli]|nr:hypothetical protein [Escherichia coli]EFO2523344.1 hypothetical protein [Escherichia coli]EFO2554888.1 hypothetical protein [Escherichia coli]EFO2698323.1 hypothetical protein [Escherichia coli]HAH8708700.1 terminase small subunit [Escherichia coli]
MEVNKKQLADIFGASIRTIQNWQERYTDKWQRRTHSLWRHRAWHASAFTGICNDLAAASTFV